jgi:hypothetical protein
LLLWLALLMLQIMGIQEQDLLLFQKLSTSLILLLNPLN